MEKREKMVILGLIIVIIALAGIALYMFYGQQHQSPTEIKVTGNKTIEKGGNLNVELSSLNGEGIKNKKINITVTDKKNNEVLKKTITTNSKGKASVELKNISKGEYVVNITFEGDKNYSSNNTTHKIKIIDKKADKTEPQTTSEETQSTESTQQNDASKDDFGLSQHKASDWEFAGRYGDTEYYSDGRGGQLVMHENDAYEFYDGKGHVVEGTLQ